MIDYTTETLTQLSIKDLKQIAAGNGAEPTGDARFKTSWIAGILTAVAIAVPTEIETAPADVVVSDASPGNVPDTAPTEIEAEILAEIDRVADAEQAAIMANDQDSAREYSDRLTELNTQFEAVIGVKIDTLAKKSMALIDSLPDCTTIDVDLVNVVWYPPSQYGCVSIDGGETYRSFRVIDPTSDRPVFKLMTRTGEIDSRWQTTAGNRYIQAIRDSLQAHLDNI